MSNPVFGFNFKVTLRDSEGASGKPIELAFAEVSGLELSVEPFVIKEGGWNHGAHQRVGRSAVGTVVLKRGVGPGRELFKLVRTVAARSYGPRIDVEIALFDASGTVELRRWKLERALPIRYRGPELRASAGEIAVEELHLNAEDIDELPPGSSTATSRKGPIDAP